MDFTDSLFELLKFVLPSLVVFATAYFTIRSFMENEQKKRSLELRRESMKLATPVRLQAYERLILLMERISPEHLVMRIHRKGISASQMREELTKTIRAEFEHNLSQQIYVSGASWSLIKQAKEETIQLINLSAGKLKPEATSLHLSEMVFKMTTTLDESPAQKAIDALKKEVQKVF